MDPSNPLFAVEEAEGDLRVISGLSAELKHHVSEPVPLCWHFVEGMNYWLNVETGERSSTRPTSTAPEAMTAAEKTQITALRFPSVADAYGHAAKLALTEDRDASASIQVRRACNFLKDGPIRVCLAFWIHALRKAPQGGGAPSPVGMNVMDLCCGRGQDFEKYRRACRDSLGHLRQLVGVDVAGPEATASAQQRWSSTASFCSSGGSGPLLGGVVRADISTRHSGQVLMEATTSWKGADRPGLQSFHLTTCMFALHYFFKDESSLLNLAMGASWLTREGGFFATVHADGEAIAAQFTPGQRSIAVGSRGRITFHDGTMQMLDSRLSHFASCPFGWGYDFHLPGAVENVTEYLVHSPTRDRVFEAHNFVKIFDEAADVVVMRMRHVDFWEDVFHKCQVDCDGSGKLTEATLDHLALYRVVVYVKNPLRVDTDVLRGFVNSKLGFSV
jgi:hypothetical protein